jgi:hypothetical protein
MPPSLAKYISALPESVPAVGIMKSMACWSGCTCARDAMGMHPYAWVRFMKPEVLQVGLLILIEHL